MKKNAEIVAVNQKKVAVLSILILPLLLLIILIYHITGPALTRYSFDKIINLIKMEQRSPDENICLISINNNRVDRKKVAELISTLSEKTKPKAIYLDLPLGEAAEDEDDDELLAESFDKAGNIYTRFTPMHSANRVEPRPLSDLVHFSFAIRTENYPNSFTSKEEYNNYDLPRPCFVNSVSCTGSHYTDEDDVPPRIIGLATSVLAPEDDGLYRKVPLFEVYEGALIPSLTLSAFFDINGLDQEMKITNNTLTIGEKRIPLCDNRYYLTFPYAGKSIKNLNFEILYRDLIEDKTFTQFPIFDNALLILCQQNEKLPLVTGSSIQPGEFFALALSNILQDDHILQPSAPVTIITTLLYIVLLISALIFFRHPLFKFLVFCLLLVLPAALYLLLFYCSTIVINFFFVEAVTLTALAVLTLIFWISRFIQRYHFSHFLSKVTSSHKRRHSLKSLTSLKKGVEQKSTVLQISMHDFTSRSHSLTPQETMAFMEEYLQLVHNIIKANHGTVYALVGDRVTAIFDINFDKKTHLDLACKAALFIKRGFLQMKQKWICHHNCGDIIKQLLPIISLNTGIIKNGIISTHSHHTLLYVGEVLQFAHKIHGWASEYGVDILCDFKTFKDSSNSFYFRKLDFIRPNSSTSAQPLFELVWKRKKVPENLKASSSLYEEGLSLYLNRDWERAISCFKESLNMRQCDDKATRILMARCNYYRANRTPENWDGAFSR